MGDELEVPEVHPLLGELRRALAGALYPAGRAALVHVARENEAPRTLLSLLSALPDRRFAGELEVVRTVEDRSLPPVPPGRSAPAPGDPAGE